MDIGFIGLGQMGFHMARRLAAGSRLRLVIAPLGASLHDQHNRNSGKPVADETAADNLVAHIQLWLGPGMSRIDLPVGEARAAPNARR